MDFSCTRKFSEINVLLVEFIFDTGPIIIVIKFWIGLIWCIIDTSALVDRPRIGGRRRLLIKRFIVIENVIGKRIHLIVWYRWVRFCRRILLLITYFPEIGVFGRLYLLALFQNP